MRVSSNRAGISRRCVPTTNRQRRRERDIGRLSIIPVSFQSNVPNERPTSARETRVFRIFGVWKGEKYQRRKKKDTKKKKRRNVHGRNLLCVRIVKLEERTTEAFHWTQKRLDSAWRGAAREIIFAVKLQRIRRRRKV